MKSIPLFLGHGSLIEGPIYKVLDASLSDHDFFPNKRIQELQSLRLDRNEALNLLALHKSQAKYGYEISSQTISHIQSLAQKAGNESPLQRLIQSPFFLAKCCWIYEHAPYFLYFSENKSEDLDSLIEGFAAQYDTLLFRNALPLNGWDKKETPWKVRAVTFWENRIFDPVGLIQRARRDNIEGLELSVDFHPFNFKKLLPEEFSQEKRSQIREVCISYGMKIDIHSPIIGPFSPSPDPRKGEQLFFDPLNCFELQCETFQLAHDIGAKSVVVHLINLKNLKKMADLVLKAAESGVRMTIENYCQTRDAQNSDVFIGCVNDIYHSLPSEVRKNYFGINLDVGHLNIEGEDPLLAAEKIGRWCINQRVFLRLHATDNYGKLLFSPPAYSADVHGNVSGKGINNGIIIKLLRSMGHDLEVVAEQIQPLSGEDIQLIHDAQTCILDETYESYCLKGKERLAEAGLEALVTSSVLNEHAYQFLAGTEGLSALKEHLVYRKIQGHRSLTIEEAKRISQYFMKMPQKTRNDFVEYVDDLLLPIQSEYGILQKSELDLICHNISGAFFGTINNEHLKKIFHETRTYQQGELICEENTFGDEMYFIKEGEVTVFINSSPLAFLKTGEIFGEMSLFYNIKRTATVKATSEKTAIGILSRAGFENLLRGGPSYSYDLIYRLYSILPERLRNLNEKYKTAMNALGILLRGEVEEINKVREKEMDLCLGMDLFSVISQEDAENIFRERFRFEKDQVIFAEGEKGNGAYLILEGKVKAVTFSERYEEIPLGGLVKGDIFGEMALIDDKPRSASIITATPAKVAFMDKKAFNDYLLTGTPLAFRLMAFICLLLFKRILSLDNMYVEIKKKFSKSTS